MPIETYAAIIAVVAIFGTFMAALAWGQWYTRGKRKDGELSARSQNT